MSASLSADLQNRHVSVNGYQDITFNIDLKNVECLNEQESHHIRNAISPGSAYLESDVDEQLSIFLTFLQSCKIYALSVQCVSEEKRPGKIYLFKNCQNIVDFDDAGNIEPTQALEVTENSYDEQGTAIINLRFVKFQDVRTLSVLILDNLGRADVTRIDNLKLYGETKGTPRNIKSVPTEIPHPSVPPSSTIDLNKDIAAWRSTVECTPSNHPNKVDYLMNLGIALWKRFETRGSVDDLNEAIVTIEQAVESTPVNHPDRGAWLSNLGIALRSRFERTGLMDDLDRAIVTNEKAVESTPVDHPHHVACINNLGIALQSRFERTGSIDDLDRAIVTIEQAIKSTPVDHPDHASSLDSLGVTLQMRFRRTGSMNDLDRAIVINENAVELTPFDHPNRASRLNNFANALRGRFERTGSMDNLDRAIVINEQAVNSTSFDHPNLVRRLSNLGSALQSRFERTGSMDDLDRAIVINEQAVELSPVDHSDHAACLNNLAITLQSRFERTGSMDDLDRAIVTKEQAVKLTPVGHPDLVGRLSNLGSALQRRFGRTGSMNDLDRAIVIIEQAVESIPVNHPNLAACLYNLGVALQSRFERSGLMDDLDRAIEIKEQAIRSTPVDHPNCAAWLNGLGVALQSRFESTGSMDDLNRAILTKEQAVKSDTAPPSIRLKAAQSCSDLLVGQRNYAHAQSILQVAVQLLPRISSRHLKRSDQQFNISQFANITSNAVSLSLENKEDLYESLRLLESGRGIVANLQLEVRSDISSLTASHPYLAQEFEELRDRIDPASISSESSVIEISQAHDNFISAPDPSKYISGRRTLLQRFDDLLRHIRSLQGFENFLQGPSESELRSLANDGAIVVFNVSNIRSDAFIITTDEICSLHLPLLTSDSMRDPVRRYFDAINERDPSRYRHAKNEMNAVLEWLWDAVVSPILNRLGFTQTPPCDRHWPRIWWVGSGLLNILPIHAAGYHNSSLPLTALDCVISSYSPTVKSLVYARERAVKAVKNMQPDNALLIAMPTTPEQSILPFVEKEVEYVRKIFSNTNINHTVRLNSLRAEILPELSKYNIVHFSCHGHTAENPSESSLCLEDWKTAPLTVSDITSLNLNSAKFAYLSACHTSAMRDFRLLDESINLSSAIQLSGYPSVVGTLWQVSDRHSSEVAKDVYEWILNEGEFDCQRSAEGLHKAIRNLRDKTRVKMGSITQNDPLIWAPYMHIGI